MKDHPEKFRVSNPYNVPIHDQGDKNNCVLHAIAYCLERQLSEKFGELTLLDVDDWWENMLRDGLATPEGTNVESAFYSIGIHGIKYTTQSGKTGIYRAHFQEKSLSEILNDNLDKS